MNQLHLYAQEAWHAPAFIVATTEALQELRNAIDIALAGNEVKTGTMTSDGEGYDLHIILDNDDEMWRKLVLPYTDEAARWNDREDAIWPHHLIGWPDVLPPENGTEAAK